jgi:hypothetical protein
MSREFLEEGVEALRRLGFDPTDEDSVLRALAEPVPTGRFKATEDVLDSLIMFRATTLKHLWAVSVLEQIGTSKSVEALKNCLTDKNQDIRGGALYALARILGPAGNQLCIEALQDSSFKQKIDVLRAIRDFDNGQAVPAVMTRMKAVLPREGFRDDFAGMTEITYALDYLRRVGASELTTVQTMVRERWEKLSPATCSWVAANMPEILSPPAVPDLTTNALLEKLRKLKFFDGYTADAERKAVKAIRKNYEQGLAGRGAKYYRQFPGFALIFLSVDLEWGSPYAPLVRVFAKASFGMFQPKKIKESRDQRTDLITLSFEVDSVTYRATADDPGGWVPEEFLDLIETAFKKHCGGLQVFETFYPESGQCSAWTFCTPKAHRALVKANLLPADHEEAVRWTSDEAQQ